MLKQSKKVYIGLGSAS